MNLVAMMMISTRRMILFFGKVQMVANFFLIICPHEITKKPKMLYK